MIKVNWGFSTMKVKMALIGAGQRGAAAYGPYALEHPDEAQFVAVAEPDGQRRENFRKAHGISGDMCFSTWREILEKPRLADAVLICTQDGMHYEAAMRALERGYHILLEKPMSTDPRQCVEMGECAAKYKRIFSICHVLRYTDFFNRIKTLLDEGRIGRLISIQHNENVAYWHQAHSYVRGNWRNSGESSPMILAKCCHDMDIMLWLAGADCTRISSFGSLTHFKRENAPPGAPLRCTDGCPAEKECQYYAPKIYLTESTDWPASVISNDSSLEARMRALKEGPYGRCVYYCDNDVVDHQVVSIEFSNEVTAAFTMCAFTNECSRTIKLMGTKGEIRGAMEKNEIEVTDFLKNEKETILLDGMNGTNGHSGGDRGIMAYFVGLVQGGGEGGSLTGVDLSVQSHLMAFAAEKSRVEGNVVDMKEYRESLRD
jgi:predicted dehydrogenase